MKQPRPGRRCLRVEPLEERSLLALSAGPDLGEWAGLGIRDAAVAEAAQVAFHGTDLVGKDGPLARLGPELIALFEQWKFHDSASLAAPFSPVSAVPLQISGDRVTVQVVAKGDVGRLVDDLAALGMQRVESFGKVIAGEMPLASLDRLAELPNLDFARPSYAPRTSAGSVLSQGDSAMRADLARLQFGVDGSGLTVGILSDSFNDVPYFVPGDGMATDIASGDLPADTSVLEDYSPGADEGRAMAQLVHDVAPGAAIRFATAFSSEPGFANNILALADAGADVIVDDVIYFDEPYFQDGIVAQAATMVANQGVPYFSSAGNSGHASYESPFVSSGIVGGPYESLLHDFDPGPAVATLQELFVPLGGLAVLGLQWDEPYGSLGGAGSASDMDIALLGADGVTLLDYSFAINVGGDPFEIVGVFNSGEYDFDEDGNPDTTFYVRIELYDGPAPGLLKYVNFYDGDIVTYDTQSGTSVGHANSAGVMGVAASWYALTPAFGTDPPLVNDFSSKGGVSILFDVAGNRLETPLDRMQPAITGVDGGNTTFFYADIIFDPDPYPNFFGTSAAAPHVAAVAALMLDAVGGPGSLSPAEVYDALESTAIDITDRFEGATFNVLPIAGGGVGFDRYSGHGLVNAAAAINAVTALSQVTGRHLFYNHSAFDGDDAGINTLDDAAIALDKSAYLPGDGLAVFDNVSSYSRGINGIMIDLVGEGDHAGISLATLANDFAFHVGQNNTPSSWTAAPAPLAVSVRANFDGSGTDRVTITWADGAIKNQWLEVEILPTARTGLATSDVFYWGSKVGDIGQPTATKFTTTAAADANPILAGGLGAASGITDPRDIDRNNVITVDGDRTAALANVGAIARIDIGLFEALVQAPAGISAAVQAGSVAGDAGLASALAAALSKRADGAGPLPLTSHEPPPTASTLPTAAASEARPALAEVKMPTLLLAAEVEDVADDLGLDEELLDVVVAGILAG